MSAYTIAVFYIGKKNRPTPFEAIDRRDAWFQDLRKLEDAIGDMAHPTRYGVYELRVRMAVESIRTLRAPRAVKRKRRALARRHETVDTRRKETKP
jgi:hypothetical protein